MNLKEMFITASMAKNSGGAVSPEQIDNAVNSYLEKNPVSGGGIPTAIQFTQVAEGTIPKDIDSSTAIDTGVSWADMKDFDWFEICIEGSGGSVSYSFYKSATPPEAWRRFPICTTYGKNRFKKIANGVYEWFNASSGNVAASEWTVKTMPYQQIFYALNGPSTHLVEIKWADTDKIYIYRSATTSIDQKFRIAGIKFK